jgi:hypothetical protein
MEKRTKIHLRLNLLWDSVYLLCNSKCKYDNDEFCDCVRYDN